MRLSKQKKVRSHIKNDIISIDLIMSLIKIFTQRQIKEKAYKVGFTKRISGLEATTFFKASAI